MIDNGEECNNRKKIKRKFFDRIRGKLTACWARVGTKRGMERKGEISQESKG